jgi:hypothetical protein
MDLAMTFSGMPTSHTTRNTGLHENRKYSPEIRRIEVPRQPGQKSETPPSQQQKQVLGMVVSACHPSDGRKPNVAGSWSRPAWAKK